MGSDTTIRTFEAARRLEVTTHRILELIDLGELTPSRDNRGQLCVAAGDVEHYRRQQQQSLG